jgi:DNA-binding NarL/FixJ family response regulator
MVKIAIAGSDPVVRSGLRALLEQDPGIQVLAAGTDPVDVLEQLLRDEPDLLLLDVRNPPITGLETILHAMQAKASTDASEPSAGDGHGGDGDCAARPQPGHVLTPREREIMKLIAGGLSNHQIAAHLVISPKTVKNHIRAAYHRMGVSGRRHAVRHWQGLAGDEGPMA